jgi:hypothetical protein
MKSPSRSVAWEEALPLAALLLVSLIAAGPLWGPGLLNTRGGGDSPFLLFRTHQLAANLRAGVFPVRWMPHAAYGFGYPFFSYYAALPYYIAAAFTLIGLSSLAAIKLTQTLFFAAAALAMYRWAAGVLRSRPGAWLAAVAYTAAPFHIVNVYVRGDSLSEFAAFAFYPLILWGLDQLAAAPSSRRLLLPVLAYAGLILTHNVSALIFSPFILLYVALQVLGFTIRSPHHSWGSILFRSSWLVASLLLALLLSAWFWLPALAETGYVQLEAQTSGYFFYGNHFRGSDLVQWHPLFDYTASDHPSPFAMGALQAALTLTGVLVAVAGLVRPHLARRNTPLRGDSAATQPRPPTSTIGISDLGFGVSHLGFAVLGLLLTTWLITPLSRPLWEHLPLLPMVQFPWRFLSVQALFTALLAGALLAPSRHRLSRANPTPLPWHRIRPGLPTTWIVALTLGASLMAAALLGLRPAYLPISADEVTPERLQLYELFTGNIGSTIRHEYLPRWVRPRPYTGPSLVWPDASPRAMVVSGELSGAERTEWRPTRRAWQVQAGASGVQVAFPIAYWPGWRATVDGTPVKVEPAPGSGYLSLDIPAGAHDVEIWLGRTPLRLASELLSLATALVLLALALGARSRERSRLQREGAVTVTEVEPLRSPSPPAGAPREGPGAGFPGHSLPSAVPYLPFAAIVALLLAFHPRVTTTSNRDLTMDFDRMPYLHHNPDGVTFQGWRLLSYSYPAGSITPGETLHVTLDWMASEDGPVDSPLDPEATLRLVSPAVIRQDAFPPVAQATIELDTDPGISARRTTLHLPVPRDAAPGLYLPQIAGMPQTYLRPVFVAGGESASGRTARATFASGNVQLHAVDVVQPVPHRLEVRLDWSTVGPLAANYGLSLSLTDPAGNEWLRQGGRPGYDTQPGLGFLPTSLWPVGLVIPDRHSLALQPGAPPGDQYTLTVDLYRVATWETVGQHTLAISLTQATRRPGALVVARLGEEIALSDIDIPRRAKQGETLQTTAYWLAMQEPSREYEAQWRLEIPGQGITAYTGTQPLAPGSSPTDWPASAWVAGRAALPIPPTAAAGDYTLSITLQDPASEAVLGTYTHPETVQIQRRQRVWELPPLDQRVDARFGGMIELAGYNLTVSGDSLHLTLHWRALSTPDRHYMLFVHLADPETGRPVEQVDTMPRAFTYPTGMWAPGEIVSDAVSLPLAAVASGRYDLAVGWYDPDTEDRLRAVDRRGNPLPDDRLLLPDGVTVP